MHKVINYLLIITFFVGTYHLCASPIKKINIALPYSPKGYVPNEVLDATTLDVLNYIFDPIFSFDNELGLTSKVLKTWSISDNRKRFVFELRKNIHFHDGSELTSKDIVFTLKEALKGKTATVTYIKSFKSIKALNKYKVQITLSKPSSLLLQSLAEISAAIVPYQYRGKTKEIFNKHPIGIGRYKFIGIEKNIVKLQRNDKYFDKAPKVKFISFYPISSKKDYIETIKNVELHDINFLLLYDIISADDLNKEKYFKFQYPLLLSAFIGMNHGLKVFSDIELRKFLYLLLKTESVNNIIKIDNYINATGLIPQGMLGNLPQTVLSRPNIKNETLQSVYQKLKTKTISISLKFYHGSEKTIKNLQRYISIKLKPFPSINIRVIRGDSKKGLKEVTAGDFELVFIRWGISFPHPYFFLIQYRTGMNHNYFKISDSFLDTQLDSFAVSSKKEEVHFFQTLDKHILDNYYVIPLYYPKPTYYLPKYMKGTKLSMSGPFEFDYSNCYWEK